jgi:hypothetical protein
MRMSSLAAATTPAAARPRRARPRAGHLGRRPHPLRRLVAVRRPHEMVAVGRRGDETPYLINSAGGRRPSASNTSHVRIAIAAV